MSDLSISKKGLSMIAGFESFAPKAYYCPAGVLTHTREPKQTTA